MRPLGIVFRFALCAACALLQACSSGLPRDRDGPSEGLRDGPSGGLRDAQRGGPLAGRVLDPRTHGFISREELVQRAIAARLVILGEVHDNAAHHRLQTEVLEAMLLAGRTPALAMEQFDREHQPALDLVRTSGERDAERIAEAGRLDRKGWRWPDYKPLVELAAANRLTILAANLSREDARALIKSGMPRPGLAPASSAFQSSLEKDIVDGHCGIRPSLGLLKGMVEAQRARDAQMAATLQRAGESGAVLIAGAGHARRDRGVPAYLSAGEREQVLSIAFIEVDPGSTEPQRVYAGLYDLVWFTPRAEREDPCKTLRLR